ncbi:hypothetical protein EDC94DRAFT_530704, partial [Helicostylum pulchrum]
RDAWKKLEGLTVLEARHIYVESLLRVAAEAYKKNIGREEAQQIIHTFAIMRPSGDDDSDDLDTDDTSNQEDDDDEDVLSRSNNHRPSSVASVQTMVTAPTTRPPSAANSVTSGVRSTRFGPNNYRINEKRPQHMTPANKDTFIEEEFDHSVNPWQHIPTTTTTTHSNKNIPSTSSSEDSIENNNRSNNTNQQYTSVVALGPATKRALESLQNEIIALNERIDDLRKELVERDRQRAIKRKSDTEEETESESDDMGDGWKWVIKAALKYASVNLMTGFILFFILYKSGSPIAYAVLKQTGKYWQTFRLRALISNVVV